jgi:formylglycine-generating enzyme required for sulfatase activity
MTNQTQDHNIATIHQLLLAAFTPEELRRFCYKRPTFRPIVDLFGPGLGFTDMVDRVVEYCDRHVLLDQLLTEVAQTNPRQYARFFGPQPPAVELEQPQQVQPPPPTPEPAPSASHRDTPTITHLTARDDKIPPESEPAGLILQIPTIFDPIPLHLVHVPAGEFVMGGVLAKDKDVQDNELPPHRIHLPEFHIGTYPVTNLQYQAFVQATGQRKPDHWEGVGAIPSGKEHHPVVNVSWKDAHAFCAWLAQESGQPVRLPTEAQWEKAARGTDGRIYPWGDEPADKNLCNFNQNVDDTTPVGQYSPQGDSSYGCTDMAGNVGEWCHSLYRPYPYQADDGREALDAEGYRVLRGGAFLSIGGGVRCACRNSYDPGLWDAGLGFRLVVAPGPSDL